MVTALNSSAVLGTVLAAMLFPAARQAWGEDQVSRQFIFGSDPATAGAIGIKPDVIYDSQRGYGFEPGYTVAAAGSAGHMFVTGDDFLFSVRVPEGNYRVTVRLGDPEGESQAAVKVEARRVVFPLTRTHKGETTELVATVNVHTPRIDDNTSVHTNGRDKGPNARQWDDKLTLEFLGARTAVQGLKIERVDDAITLFLAGDSTVTDQAEEPWAAWGQLLPQFFGPKVSIANYAESGRTLKSFKSDLRWAKILSQAKAGDYVFIQFGHNDMKEKGENVGPFTSFSASLREYIADVRAKNATPVLVTPMHRRHFQGDQIMETFGDYPDAVRKVAEQEHVDLIDLHTMSKPLYEAFGPEKSKQLFVYFPANTFPGQDKPLKDDTHFRAFGAEQIARCIVQGIKDKNLPIAQYLRPEIPTFDPAKPNDPATYDLPTSKPEKLVVPEGH